jgi:hypothetical protein
MGNMMADVVLEYGNKVFKREGKIISICILNNGGISHSTKGNVLLEMVLKSCL